MNITRKDIGYTVYSRLEEALRLWVRQVLLTCHGEKWLAQVPGGIADKVRQKLEIGSLTDIDDPLTLLEQTDLPDITEIILYKKAFPKFVTKAEVDADAFKSLIQTLYDLRNKIAHMRQTFTALDLDRLLSIATMLMPVVQLHAHDLSETLACLQSNPERVVIHIPSNFFIQDEPFQSRQLTNLPPADYDPDGGFIGRKDDLERIKGLVLGDLHRVITIVGAGGVGKTALAHRTCQRILAQEPSPFSAVVWVSAKEEILTAAGIEPLDVGLRTYDDLLDSILETFGWVEDIERPTREKEHSVEVILSANDKGVLLVVDNLETVSDPRVIDFLKDFPPPSKVLITSRSGLGEVERRFPLKELAVADAVQLLRTVSLEKGVHSLVKLSDDTLANYVDRMARYPLAIKWVVGQVALGKDLEVALSELLSPSGDVARFCFERIFGSMISDGSRLILFALASYDRPLTRGILSHLTLLKPEDLDEALRELTIASLVIPSQVKTADARIETNYDLLPLTRNFIRSKLMSVPDIRASLQARIQGLHTLLEESERAARQLTASLPLMGAQTEEEKIAATYAVAGVRKSQTRDYLGAVEAFERSVQIAPRFAPAHREWANAESLAGFPDKAEEHINRAASLAPRDPMVWATWGLIEMRRSRYDEAARHLRKALEINPNDNMTISAMAEVEKRREHFAEAVELYHRLVNTSGPTRPTTRGKLVACTALADCLRRWAEQLRDDREAELAKLREAYTYARRALEMDPSDEHAQDTHREVSVGLSIALWRGGDPKRALERLKEAIAKDPRTRRAKLITARACYFATRILIQDGSSSEARKYFELGRPFVPQDGTFATRYADLSLEFSSKRSVGEICQVVPDRGFGFIAPDDRPDSKIFVHITSFVRELTGAEFGRLSGTKVSFLTIQTQKRPEAKCVRILSTPAGATDASGTASQSLG